MLKNPVGTEKYAAPEIFNHHYNCTTDVYSIGRILQYFIDNNMPIGIHGYILLEYMLESDPLKRITLTDMLDSEWFVS